MGIVFLWTNKVSLIHFLRNRLIFIFVQTGYCLFGRVENSISMDESLMVRTNNMEQNVPLFFCKQMDVWKGLRKFWVFRFLAPDLFLLQTKCNRPSQVHIDIIHCYWSILRALEITWFDLDSKLVKKLGEGIFKNELSLLIAVHSFKARCENLQWDFD